MGKQRERKWQCWRQAQQREIRPAAERPKPKAEGERRKGQGHVPCVRQDAQGCCRWFLFCLVFAAVGCSEVGSQSLSGGKPCAIATRSPQAFGGRCPRWLEDRTEEDPTGSEQEAQDPQPSLAIEGFPGDKAQTVPGFQGHDERPAVGTTRALRRGRQELGGLNPGDAGAIARHGRGRHREQGHRYGRAEGAPGGDRGPSGHQEGDDSGHREGDQLGRAIVDVTQRDSLDETNVQQPGPAVADVHATPRADAECDCWYPWRSHIAWSAKAPWFGGCSSVTTDDKDTDDPAKEERSEASSARGGSQEATTRRTAGTGGRRQPKENYGGRNGLMVQAFSHGHGDFVGMVGTTPASCGCFHGRAMGSQRSSVAFLFGMFALYGDMSVLVGQQLNWSHSDTPPLNRFGDGFLHVLQSYSLGAQSSMGSPVWISWTTFHFLLVMQHIGTLYLLMLNVLLSVVLRLSFFSFDKGPHQGISEASWQILRGSFWAILTFAHMWGRLCPARKRLVKINQRRYSIKRCKRCTSCSRHVLLCGLVLSSHIIPAAKATLEIDHAPIPHGDSFRDYSGNDTTHIHRENLAMPIDFVSCRVDAIPQDRILAYGHHSVLGACGVRVANLAPCGYADITKLACSLWSSIHKDLFCEAYLTSPQPSGTETTLIVLLDSGLRIGPTVLADIDLFGGVPRRHTLALPPEATVSHIIQSVDRDRICFPRGIISCAVSHSTTTFLDFDHYLPQMADFLRVFEADHLIFLDDDAALSLRQTSTSLVSRSQLHDAWRLHPKDIQETCLLDEAVFDFPEDENDIFDLPAQHLWMNRDRSLAQLRLWSETSQDPIYLDTYGLHDSYIGNRMLRLSEWELQNIVRAVARLWYEYAAGSHFFIYQTDWQPANVPPRTLVILVVIPTPSWDHVFYKATLIDVVKDAQPTDRTAAYVPRTSYVTDIAQAVGEDQSCWPQGLDQCFANTKSQHLAIEDEFHVLAGDYITFIANSITARMALLQNSFPSAESFVRDALWRSRHYGIQEFTILLYIITPGQSRLEPRALIRTLETLQWVDELWDDAVGLWSTHGTSDASQLQRVWPQTVFQSHHSNIHLIVNSLPPFPHFSILLSIIVRLGQDPPRRLESHAWLIPRQLSVSHLLEIVGLAGFVRTFSGPPTLTYANNNVYGPDDIVQIECGGHYELHLHLEAWNHFILAVIRNFPATDPLSYSYPSRASSSEDDNSLLQLLPLKGKGGSVVLQSHVLDRWCIACTTFHPPAVGTGNSPDPHQEPGDVDVSLLQTSLILGLAIHGADSSYSDLFLDRVWPMTEEGERQLAGDLDVGTMRSNWQRVNVEHGIPRPVDVATLIICRPAEIGLRVPGLQLPIARFDDPRTIPTEIVAHWNDLSGHDWRIFPGHASLRDARTPDVDGWHFVLLTSRYVNSPGFAAGFLELVSRHHEDEHSILFTAVLPVESTWTHLWSWLRLGNLFSGNYMFQILHNSVAQPMTHMVFTLSHGFFIQIVAQACTEADYIGIPSARINRWTMDFRFLPQSSYGLVFRAGMSIDESISVRLPYQDRDQEIIRQWPDLTVWNLCPTHPAARYRGPPWAPSEDVHLVQANPDGNMVAILCSIYEGGGAIDHAIVIHRQSSVLAIHHALRCAFRCASADYICHTHHNGVLVPFEVLLNLEEGDFVEVFLLWQASNTPSQQIGVPDSETQSSLSATTFTSTWYCNKHTFPCDDNGCRYDFVHRPIDVGMNVLGGSSTHECPRNLYTWSFVIFRQFSWSLRFHPLLDVDPLHVRWSPQFNRMLLSATPSSLDGNATPADLPKGRTDLWLGSGGTTGVHSHVSDLWCNVHSLPHGSLPSGFTDLEEDITSLMQHQLHTPPTVSSNPATVQVRLVGLHGLSAHVDVDPTLTLFEQMETLWPFSRTPHNSVYMYHPVHEPPSYASHPSEQLFIVQFQNDHFSQVNEDDVLILAIIRFSAPHSSIDSSKHRARVIWAPRQVTRLSLLQFLRVNWHCRRPTIICHIFVNQALWPELDTATRNLESGDYIRLQVRSDREQLCDIIWSETNARRQRIWESSSEDQHAPDSLSPEESESEDPPRDTLSQRSRSRERFSLIQISAVRHRAIKKTLYPLSLSALVTSFLVLTANSSWYPHPLLGLPPPGNGALVDLRKNLDLMDDYSTHDWGYVIFDVDGSRGVGTDRLSAVQVETPPTTVLIDALFTASVNDFPHTLLEDNCEDFPTELQPLIRELSTEQCIEPSLIQIFTDGSFDSSTDSPVGWGFVALTCGTQGLVIEHLACGYVDEFCPLLHGHPVTLSARTGEIEALIQATLWSVASLKTLPFKVFYDAISAGHSAFGYWNHNPTDRHLRILRALMQFAQLHHQGGFSGEHVYAHTGVLGNEIANFLAQFARLHRYQCGAVDISLAPFTMGDRMPLEWLWMQAVPYSELSPSYPSFEGEFLHAKCTEATSSITTAFPALLQHDADVEESTKRVTFGAATYNVGSLLRHAHGRPDNMAPQEYLRRQSQAHGIDCLFLQETRARHEGLIASDTHIRLVAAADMGHGGTEIWLAKRDEKGRKTGLSPKDVLVLLANNQVVLVRARWPCGKFLLLSAHSPHSGRSKEDISQWWSELTQAICQYYNPKEEWLVCGLDANAHFDQAHEPWIGDHGLERSTNHPAECFLEFLQKLDLCAPATFSNIHSGPTATWRLHQQADAARCDYLCIPVQWRPAQLLTRNIPSLDAGTSSMDHTATGLWCNIHFVKRRCQRPAFDRDGIENSYKEHGHVLMQSLSSIGWDTDVHCHGALISDKIKSWLEEFCPTKRDRPRASFISDDTWLIRRHRLWLGRQLRGLDLQWTTLHLRVAFCSWKFGRTLGEVFGLNLDLSQQILRAIRLTKEHLSGTRNQLRRALRRDRTAFLEEVAKDAICDHPNALHRHLRRAGVQSRSKRSALQPLPCLNDLSGQKVTSFEQFAETWRKQFEIQEDGIPRTQDELLSHCVKCQNWDMALDQPPDWSMIPTLRELEQVLRQTKTKKAFFDDMVPGEILHFAANDLAMKLYPLLLKQWLFHQEPVSFKGGLLVSAYKKGDAADPNNYRSLLVSPTIAKAFHRLLRGDLMKFFEPVALPLQLGGRPGISVTQASHVLHNFLHHMRVLKRPTAVVFLDIRNAFYRLFRQHLLKCGSLDRSVEELFASLSLPDAARRDFAELLGGETAMESAEIPSFWQSQVRELFNSTWFMVSGTSVLTEARKGSRPGDSAADLLFSIAFRHLLRQVSDQASDRGVVNYLTWNGCHVPFHDDLERTELMELLGPIWADDVAILLDADDAATLVRNTQVVLGLLFDQLVVAGMSPNLGRSKTEILFDLRGKGSVALRKHFAFNDYKLPTISKHMAAYVNIVGAYKHLGSWVQINGKLSKELSCRVAMGHTTMSKYRSTIFSNRELPLVRKVHLFQSLVLSAVLFNAPAWYLQRKKDVERFHSGIMALYRRLANSHFGLQARTWRDATVQARLSLPSPITLLHLHRLRYLQHIVRRGDSAVWASLQQHSYWWEMVDLSLTWLRENVLRPLPDTPVSDFWQHWVPLLAPPGGAWQSLLRRAVRHDALQTRKSSAWYDFHVLACHYLVDQGFQVLPFYAVECDQFACARCRQSFRTCSAWSVHAFRKHGRTTISRQVAQGDSCAICLKKFHDHNGLVNHIKNNPDCFWQLRTLNGLVAPQASLNSRTELRNRTELRTPVYRLHGPKPPTVEVADPTPSAEQQVLFDAWELVRNTDGIDLQDHERVRELLRIATLDTTLPIHEILYVAWSWLRLLRLRGLVVQGQGFDAVFVGFIRGLDAPWLLQDQSLRRPRVTDPEEILTLWMRDAPSALPIPRPLKLMQVIVAHLFSGRRRVGDLQAQLERLHFPRGHHLQRAVG